MGGKNGITDRQNAYGMAGMGAKVRYTVCGMRYETPAGVEPGGEGQIPPGY